MFLLLNNNKQIDSIVIFPSVHSILSHGHGTHGHGTPDWPTLLSSVSVPSSFMLSSVAACMTPGHCLCGREIKDVAIIMRFATSATALAPATAPAPAPAVLPLMDANAAVTAGRSRYATVTPRDPSFRRNGCVTAWWHPYLSPQRKVTSP